MIFDFVMALAIRPSQYRGCAMWQNTRASNDYDKASDALGNVDKQPRFCGLLGGADDLQGVQAFSSWDERSLLLPNNPTEVADL
jgi:hypothetical protein